MVLVNVSNLVTEFIDPNLRYYFQNHVSNDGIVYEDFLFFSNSQ